jgi:putative SOS response-associated peptidase YedK
VTILTTAPNDVPKPIQDRMPVVLPRNVESDWLAAAPDTRKDLRQPYPKDDLEAYEISTCVNNPVATSRKLLNRLTTDNQVSASSARGNWRRSLCSGDRSSS